MHGDVHDTPIKTEEDLIGALYIAYGLSIEHGRWDSRIRQSMIETLWEVEYARYLLQLDVQHATDRNRRDIEASYSVDRYPSVPILKQSDLGTSFQRAP
jgi:hypothetical protein